VQRAEPDFREVSLLTVATRALVTAMTRSGVRRLVCISALGSPPQRAPGRRRDKPQPCRQEWGPPVLSRTGWMQVPKNCEWRVFIEVAGTWSQAVWILDLETPAAIGVIGLE
jgi:hypothetical protein